MDVRSEDQMRVLLADDQAWLRSAIRLLLEQQIDVETVGEAADAQHLRREAMISRPDLVLLDWELPGIQVAGQRHALLNDLRKDNPKLQIIVLSGLPESSRAAIAAGANAFVSKADPPEQLLAALQKARQSINMA